MQHPNGIPQHLDMEDDVSFPDVTGGRVPITAFSQMIGRRRPLCTKLKKDSLASG